MILQPDGKIVVVGSCGPPGRKDFAVVRYHADGRLDDHFGKAGVIRVDLGGDDYAVGVAQQPDGRIVVAGHTGPPRSRDFVILRYDGDGRPDRRFGRDGVVRTDLGPPRTSDDSAACLALQPDGKIVVAGFSDRPGTYDFAVVRYNADGSLDDGSPRDSTPGDRFGPDGMAFADFGGRDEIWSVALQPDGKIVVAGFSWREIDHTIGFDTLGIKVARLDGDGSLDPSFGEGGKVATNLPGNGRAFDLALQPDGKIVVAASQYRSRRTIERRVPLADGGEMVVRPPDRPLPGYDLAVVRYNGDGSPDERFGDRGVVLTDLGSPQSSPLVSLALQADGTVVVCGGAIRADNWDFVVVRYMGQSGWVPRWW
jgi:uncharacterized delta-60 repeat protein